MSMFLSIVYPLSKNSNLRSTYSFILSPKRSVGITAKLSILAAKEHLLAKKREILPLSYALAREINPEWNKVPYLGVADFVFKALNKAFSAPNI